MTRFGLFVGGLGGALFVGVSALSGLLTQRFDPHSFLAAAIIAVGVAAVIR
ncbi:hypothetical protein [Alsobacter sp. R-9]